MTEGQRQHLLAWTTSMRKVGKGTGKNAHIHLQDAQKHMSECRDAIPAWIMPLYRVFETFDVKPNLFDVVIIDEASQSGPDAVILQYIAKKLIVVGDDKQISPEYVGIKREDVQYLRKQYLRISNLRICSILKIPFLISQMYYLEAVLPLENILDVCQKLSNSLIESVIPIHL